MEEPNKSHWKTHWKSHLAIISILALITLFYFKDFIGPNLPARDISLAHLPNLYLLENSWEKYSDLWPLWNPYGFSGEPNLMRPILGFDSLPGIFILLGFSPLFALKGSFILYLLLAGISMYLLLSWFRLQPKYAFLGAMVYMLNGHVAKLLLPGWITTLGPYALMPLVILFSSKAIREKTFSKSLFHSIITALLLSITLRSGPDMKAGLFVLLLFSIFMLFNAVIPFSAGKAIKIGMLSGIILIIFFGLSADRILSHADFIKKTSRSETTWEQSSSRRVEYSQLFPRLIEPLQNFGRFPRQGSGDHIGILASALAIYAVWKRRTKTVIFFALIALLSILVATNTFGLYYLLWKLPFFSSMRYMDRILFLFAFAGSALAGFGVQEFFARNEKARAHEKIIFGGIIALIFLNLFVLNFSHYSGDVAQWSDINEVLRENKVLNDLAQRDAIFRIQTWETRGIDWGTDLFNVPLGLEHIYQYNTQWYPPYFNQFLGVAWQQPAKFWALLNVRYITAQQPLNISHLLPVAQFPGCAVCFPGEPNIQKAWGPYLYENDLFLPRAYVVNSSIAVIGSESQVTNMMFGLMLNKFYNPTGFALIRGKQRISSYAPAELNRYSAVILTPGSVDSSSASQSLLQGYVAQGGILLPDTTKGESVMDEQQVEQVMFTFSPNLKSVPDSKVLMQDFDTREIKLDGQKGFLVLSEKFSVFGGWAAEDRLGDEKELLNANIMNSAVYLDGNEQSLSFMYLPRPYRIGRLIVKATIGLIIFFALLNLLLRYVLRKSYIPFLKRKEHETHGTSAES
ncbi:hypothetical protein HYU14_00675 [Candidatus Woesearchaeota archaeon]|nr:hypothetical protein [Candidatus Woesearchaeota archaeon]